MLSFYRKASHDATKSLSRAQAFFVSGAAVAARALVILHSDFCILHSQHISADNPAQLTDIAAAAEFEADLADAAVE